MTFNSIVIDPPWPITMAGQIESPRHRRPERLTYNTMSLADIKALPIGDIANPGAHIYLWATNKTLRDAFDVLEGWSIAYHQTLVMTKPSGMTPSLGYVFGTEFCLLGFNGRPMQPFTDIGALNWFSSPSRQGKHSVKPDAFYDLVERMSPGPYAEIFARRKRFNWSVWGNETFKDFDFGLRIMAVEGV